MKVIFMGTPDFAVPSLQKLIDSSDHDVVAVFTKEPKKKNRGMELLVSPIYKLAQENNIAVHTPKGLRNENAVELLNNIDADIIVVVAYGLIIPQNILEIKKYGCLNIHPSKLPKYRGAAPLQRAIINNEKETAICIMQMDAGVDTGDILMQKDLSIAPETNVIQLHDQCSLIGSELLIQVLDNINNITPVKQTEEGMTYANKLSKEEGEISWQTDDINQIYGKIKGMNPWPGAYFYINDKVIKILEAEITLEDHGKEFGVILNKKFDVACIGGVLKILKVKPEGKREMPAEDFLRGREVNRLI